MWWVWRECGVVLTDVGGTDVVPGSCTSTHWKAIVNGIIEVVTIDVLAS